MKDFKLERYFAKHEFSAKYMMSSSDCDGFSMEYVLQNSDSSEIKLWDELRLGYTESLGLPLLRENIASMYQSITADNIMVATPGELNYMTMNLLVGKGDHAIVPYPAYQSLYEVIRSKGCDISFWEPEKGSWKFSVERLEELVRPNTKLIVINFPHNPTGAYITKEELESVVEIADSLGAWIFSDEMYRGLIINEEVEELPSVCDLYDKGISLWGMAKSFALAGLRIGWLCCRDVSFMNDISSFKAYLSICNSAPSELLSAFAINHKDLYIPRNIAKIKKNLSLFDNFVKSSRNRIFLPYTQPLAGSVAFVPISYSGSALEFSDNLVERSGIMTIPSEVFEYPGKYLRIGFGRESMRECLEILNNF